MLYASYLFGALIALSIWAGFGWLISLTGTPHPYAAAFVLWCCVQVIGAIWWHLERTIATHELYRTIAELLDQKETTS